MVSVPLSIINMFGGIVSGVWLAILGEWGLIGYGILAMMVSGLLLGFAMMPGLIFAVPAATMFEKGIKIGGYFFGFLGTVYTLGVLSVWCVFVLVYFMDHATVDSVVPVLVWSYGVATAPIMWLTQKELQSGNEHALVATFFIECAYIFSILAILFIGVSLVDVLIIFAITMTLGMIFQFSLTYLVQKEQQYY